MASNTTLSPLHEFRLACEEMPEYAPSAWWNALAPEKVLEGHAARFGRLALPEGWTVPETAEIFLRHIRKDWKIQALEPLAF